MQCEESRGRDSWAMMIRVSHSDVRVSHGMHVHTASSDVRSGRFQSHEVFNSLMQPGVDFVPWVTQTQKAYKLWATLKGQEWLYRRGY
jgi:hypothetical protein